MDFLITIFSDITYDLAKNKFTFTKKLLKENLKGWVLKEEDYQELADKMNVATDIDKKTKLYWRAFLDSNEDIKVILTKAQNIKDDITGNMHVGISLIDENNNIKKIENENILEYYEEIVKDFRRNLLLDIYIKPNVYKIYYTYKHSFSQKSDADLYENKDYCSLIEADEYINNWCSERESKVLLLVGEHGYGKSSFCKKMIYDYYYSKTVQKAFYFNLNPNNSSIIQGGRLNENTLLDLDELKYSIVFLDGFDELYLALQKTDDKNINYFIDRVLQYAKENYFKVVITSTKSYVDTNDRRLANKNVQIVGLEGFTKNQHKHFIKAYNKLHNKNYDIDKLEIMYKNELLNKLIKIPNLFQLIVANNVDLK